jgi:hypothetical protein
MQHIIGIHNPNQTNIIKINPLASIWVPTKTSISLFLKLSIIFRNQIYLRLSWSILPIFALGKIVTSSCSIARGFRQMEQGVAMVNPRNGFYVYDTLKHKHGRRDQ